MATISNQIIIGLMAVVIALATTGASSFEAIAPSAAAAPAIHRSARLRPIRVGGSGNISGVHNVARNDESQLARLLREAGKTDDNRATALVVGGAAIVFEHTSKIYRKLAPVLSGISGNFVTVSGHERPIRSSDYDYAGIDRVESEFTGIRSIRIENIDISGNPSPVTDVVAVAGRVKEVPRTIEVPMTAYCLCCKRNVYRHSVSAVYIPSEGYEVAGYIPYLEEDNLAPGEYHYETDSRYAGDPYFRAATVGACVNCEGWTMTFGAETTRTVLSSDYIANVVPAKPEPARKPIAERSEMLHATAYCMACRADVGRKGVQLVVLANGREATVGDCARTNCGRPVYRMGGYIELSVVNEIDRITDLGYGFAYLMNRVVDPVYARRSDLIPCDFSTCDDFASRRGYRMMRVPGRMARRMIDSTRVAFCEGHHEAIQGNYARKSQMRAA